MSEANARPRPGHFHNGFFAHNPIFTTFLGLCPSLAVTAVVYHAFVLSVVVSAVLLLSALCVSLLRTVVPLPFQRLVTLALMAVLTVIATMLLSRYMPDVREALGIYLPLVAVNVVVISQVQTVSWTSAVGQSLGDAAGRAAGFLVGLVLIALLRESIGSGTITLIARSARELVVVLPGLSENPVSAVATSVGAFLIAGYLSALVRVVRRRKSPGRMEDDA